MSLVFLKQPARLHPLEFIVQHKSAKPVGHVMISEEFEKVLVELERHRKLTMDLKENKYRDYIK